MNFPSNTENTLVLTAEKVDSDLTAPDVEMNREIQAVYEDDVIKPLAPVLLPAGARVSLVIESATRKYLLIWPVLLFLGVLSALLALYAQQIATDAHQRSLPSPPLVSWLLFGLSAMFFTAAVWPVPELSGGEPKNTTREILRLMRRSRTFMILLGVALFCFLAELPLFYRLNTQEPAAAPDDWLINSGSWMFYVGSLLAWLFAFIVWERTSSSEGVNVSGQVVNNFVSPEQLTRRMDRIVLVALFALALVLRFIHLGTAPPGFWFDEAQNGVVARRLVSSGAAHPVFIGDYTQMGSLYFYLQGFVIKLFGSSIWSVRMLPALSGSVIVALIYLLASRLYGWRVGLIAGLLVAVSSWHLTFSRFGIASMFTVALDVAVYFCLERALRTTKLIYFAVAGLLLGMAVHTYFVARLVPFVIVALLVHRLITERLRLVRRLQTGAVVFALGALLGAAPMLLFSAQKPEVFNQRIKTASIFSEAGSGGDPTPVRTSLAKHLLMFNYQGDWNGRHNIPNEPLLDWMMAAFFFAGLGACLLRSWRWQYFFPVIWFIAALSGGVLSLLFEAPQSHRTLENSVVTALVAGIFLGELWQLLQYAVNAATFRRMVNNNSPYVRFIPSAVVSLIVAVTLIYISAVSLHRYFNLQVNNRAVWSEMGAAEGQVASTLAGTLARPDRQHDVYVSDRYFQINHTEFLAGNVPHKEWAGLDLLPLESTGDKGTIILLEPRSTADLAMIARTYPHTVFEILHTPLEPDPMLYRITIPAEDLRDVHGVRLSILLHSTGTGNTTGKEQTLTSYEYQPGPDALAAATIRLDSTLKVEDFGDYAFHLEQPANFSNAKLTIDGQTIQDGQAVVSLARGLHRVVVTAQSGAAGAPSAATPLRLLWKSTNGAQYQPIDAQRLYDPRRIEPHGLTGTYRAGLSYDNVPTLVRIDPVISFLYHHTPLSRPYTVEWTGRLYIPQSGNYILGTEQRSRSILYIDGAESLNNTVKAGLKEVQLNLSAGFHEVRLRFEDDENYSQVFLYWTPPGRKRSIIPSAFLWPTVKVNDDPPEHATLPTLDESDGSQIPANRIQPFRMNG